ncbi:MAG: glycosyltransferase family 2 protein [Bacteroidota bacterium]|nr:glycosyltransferase family 2 protein [Bacteroidota bacterium]
MYLSLIVPAYKEASRISASLEKIFAYLANASYDSEVIVVDDGSPDNSVEVIRTAFAKKPAGRVEARLIELGTNGGKGAAVRAGMLEAKGSIRIFTDADLSTPIHEVEKVIMAIEKEGYDVVVGSRALEGRKLVKVHQPMYREMMGRFFNLLVQVFVLRGIKDTQCGFKGFRAEAAAKIFAEQKVMGFSFDVEILYLARKYGYKIKEVAVEWYNDERTTVGALSDSAKMFLELLRIRNLHKGS